MTKKKDEPQAPEVDPRAPIETSWRGVVRWQCPFCPTDNADRAVIERHIAHAHREPSLSVSDALAAQNVTATAAPVTNEPGASEDASDTSAPETAPEKEGD